MDLDWRPHPQGRIAMTMLRRRDAHNLLVVMVIDDQGGDGSTWQILVTPNLSAAIAEAVAREGTTFLAMRSSDCTKIAEGVIYGPVEGARSIAREVAELTAGIVFETLSDDETETDPTQVN